jgi:acetyltransferase-like isoleucine patch superfamily enzyme
MAAPGKSREIHKAAGARDDGAGKSSAIARYRAVFVGRDGWLPLLQLELVTMLCGSLPGALGYLLRSKLLPRLMARVGRGVQWGRNIALRHPGKMEIGEGTVIDDACLLDARGVAPGGFRIGERAVIARNVAIQARTDVGFVEIGDDCTIGNNCTLSSTGGIRIGNHVGIGGHSYIGGGRYRIDRGDVPMMKQPLYTRGAVEIGDDCWIGAGVCILDGVRIGSGSVIGAGAVIRENVPPGTILVPQQPHTLSERRTIHGPAGDALSQ